MRLLRHLRPGQVGCLRAGTFTEDVKFTRRGAPGKPVTLRSAPGEGARLVGRLWISRHARYAAVRGLWLDGRNRTNLPSPTVNADDVVLAGNDITNERTAICVVLGSDVWGRADRAVVELNRIHGCGVLPATRQQHGLYVAVAREAIVRNNWIYDNADYGIHLYPDAQGSRIRDNVIYGNGSGVTFSGDGRYASSGNLVEHNVIANSLRGFNVDSWWPPGGPIGKGNVLRGNCLYGGVPHAAAGSVMAPQVGFAADGNLVADPQPANPRRGQVLPASASRCREVFGGSAILPGPRTRPAAVPRCRRGSTRRGRRSARRCARS
jgi:parallel beta-helix repeat protein